MRRSEPKYGQGGPGDEDLEVARSMARAATTGRNLWSPSTPRGRSDGPKSRTLGGDQVEGRQAVRELLAAGRRQVREVWMTEGNDPAPILGEIDSLARARHIPVRLVSHRRLESVQGTESPQGVVAFAEPLEAVSLEELVLGGAWGESSRPAPGRRPGSERDLESALDDEGEENEADDALVFVELDDDLEELEGPDVEVDGEGDEVGESADAGEGEAADSVLEADDADEAGESAEIGSGEVGEVADAGEGEADDSALEADDADEAGESAELGSEAAGGADEVDDDGDDDGEIWSEAAGAGDPQEVLAEPAEPHEEDGAIDRAGLAPAGNEGGELAKGCFLVLVDGVTDPQNLGAILRSAECAGATGVVIPRHRSAHVTPAVTKAAAGAIEHLPMALVAGIPSALQDLGRLGVTTIGLDERGQTDFFDVELGDRPVALVLGAEGAGLGPLARRRCEVLAKIPLNGEIPSLNVSAAAAVACFEVARQRRR